MTAAAVAHADEVSESLRLAREVRDRLEALWQNIHNEIWLNKPASSDMMRKWRDSLDASIAALEGLEERLR